MVEVNRIEQIGIEYLIPFRNNEILKSFSEKGVSRFKAELPNYYMGPGFLVSNYFKVTNLIVCPLSAISVNRARRDDLGKEAVWEEGSEKGNKDLIGSSD